MSCECVIVGICGPVVKSRVCVRLVWYGHVVMSRSRAACVICVDLWFRVAHVIGLVNSWDLCPQDCPEPRVSFVWICGMIGLMFEGTTGEEISPCYLVLVLGLL